MSTTELKRKLISRIKESKDKNVLNAFLRLLKSEHKVETYKVTEAQRKAINEARKQIKKGQFLTNEQANKEAREWLKK